MSKDQRGLFGQLDDVRGILSSFDERLSSFSGLEPGKQSKSSIWNSLSDAFKPASAEPLLDMESPRTGRGSLLSQRDSSTQGLDLAPSNPLGLPGSTSGGPTGQGSLYLSSGMFRDLFELIPNLEIGYLHSFGGSNSGGRLTFDYLAPISLGENASVFLDCHGEFTDFWKSVTSIWSRRSLSNDPTVTSTMETFTTRSLRERTDLSFGIGYRRIFNDVVMLGVNGYYDRTKTADRWFTSGGLGVEMQALLPGNDSVDLSFNWYGDLFRVAFRNYFSRAPANYDFNVGYLHELYEQGPDLRIGVKGYSFEVGDSLHGINGSAEIRTRDGMFGLKYDCGHDRFNGTYQTIGGSVNVGLRLENLARWESPILAPEPIFRSQRNLKRWLSRRPVRDFHQSVAAVASRQISESSWVLVYTDTLGSTCVWPNHTGIGFTPGLRQTDFSGPPAGILIEVVFSGTTSHGSDTPPAELFYDISCTADSSRRLGTAILPLPDSGAVGTVRGLVLNPEDFYNNLRTIGNMRFIRWQVPPGLTFSPGWWNTRVNVYELQ